MPSIEDADTTNVTAMRVDPTADDNALIDVCAEAGTLLRRVIGWNERDYPGDQAASDTQRAAWTLTRQAMASDVTSLAGVRAQAELMLLHHECQGAGPEHPEIELPLIRNLLRLLPVAA
jgi:hypothetical protein